MVLVLKKILFSLQHLQTDMPFAYSQALASAQSLLEGASQLSKDSVSPDGKELLVTATQGVLEGTIKV